MIIDAHCHAGRGDGFTGPWDTVAPLGVYLRRAFAAGIDRTVLFAAFHSDYAAANREVLDHDNVLHSHTAPDLWQQEERYASYVKFTSIRNPLGIVNSAS